MSFVDLLIDTCTIRRYTTGAADDYGKPVETWADHISDQACRLMVTTGREIKIGAEVVIADYKLFIDDVDVTEQDRVIISAITYEVLLTATKKDSDEAHHKELAMRTVR